MNKFKASLDYLVRTCKVKFGRRNWRWENDVLGKNELHVAKMLMD